MKRDGIQFHNTAALRPVGDRDGRLIQRVPESVRTDLNDGASERMIHPAGVELRFVPDGTVELTLSTLPGGSASEGVVRVFWGPLQSTEEYVVGAQPRTIELSMPDRVARLKPSATERLSIDPRVCRVRLSGDHRGGPVLYHGASGECRPPTGDELPDQRYLAYGTSITEGEAPLGEHLTYVNRTAHRLDADPVNLGVCGSAYCDEAMADYIAARDDWDVATLALSVNMFGNFAIETFRERAAYMVETVAGAHPDAPVGCITLFRNSRDVLEGAEDGADSERFREALREVVANSDHDNVHLIEGTDLLPDIAGLTTDLLHPGDIAMATIAERLAGELRPLVDDRGQSSPQTNEFK